MSMFLKILLNITVHCVVIDFPPILYHFHIFVMFSTVGLREWPSIMGGGGGRYKTGGRGGK